MKLARLSLTTPQLTMLVAFSLWFCFHPCYGDRRILACNKNNDFGNCHDLEVTQNMVNCASYSNKGSSLTFVGSITVAQSTLTIASSCGTSSFSTSTDASFQCVGSTIRLTVYGAVTLAGKYDDCTVSVVAQRRNDDCWTTVYVSGEMKNSRISVTGATWVSFAQSACLLTVFFSRLRVRVSPRESVLYVIFLRSNSTQLTIVYSGL